MCYYSQCFRGEPQSNTSPECISLLRSIKLQSIRKVTPPMSLTSVTASAWKKHQQRYLFGLNFTFQPSRAHEVCHKDSFEIVSDKGLCKMWFRGYKGTQLGELTISSGVKCGQPVKSHDKCSTLKWISGLLCTANTFCPDWHKRYFAFPKKLAVDGLAGQVLLPSCKKFMAALKVWSGRILIA